MGGSGGVNPMIALWSHVSLIKPNAVILFCCGTATVHCSCYMGHVKAAKIPVGTCVSYSFLSPQWNSVLEEWKLCLLRSERDGQGEYLVAQGVQLNIRFIG